MKKIPRIVPWTSPEEFQQVHKWLYEKSPNLRELGVKRVQLYFIILFSNKKKIKIYFLLLQVKAWSSRGRVPHAIASTSAFVEVSLRDEFGYGKISNHELRLLYSMVFIRYENNLI